MYPVVLVYAGSHALKAITKGRYGKNLAVPPKSCREGEIEKENEKERQLQRVRR